MLKTAKIKTLKTKVNSLERKTPDATTLIHINQYNTDKQNIEKKTGIVDKKYQRLQLFWTQKLVELRTKYQILKV